MSPTDAPAPAAAEPAPRAPAPPPSGDPSTALGARLLRGKWWIAALTLGPLLAASVPYYRSVKTEYEHYHAYVAQTLDDPSAPPLWDREALSPPGCVDEAVRWAEACPAQQEFCKGSVAEIMRRCLGTQDHRAYCADQGEAWLTTNFGYAACEATLEGLDEKKARRRKGLCAGGWRGIGRHCIELARRPAG